MLAEVSSNLLVYFGLALSPLYGLCVESATLGEFNHIASDYIYIAEFTISNWMRHEEHLNLLLVCYNPLLCVPYNLLRHLRMAGGSYWKIPCLNMPVFVILPECYYGSMSCSNISQREM